MWANHELPFIFHFANQFTHNTGQMYTTCKNLLDIDRGFFSYTTETREFITSPSKINPSKINLVVNIAAGTGKDPAINQWPEHVTRTRGLISSVSHAHALACPTVAKTHSDVLSLYDTVIAASTRPWREQVLARHVRDDHNVNKQCFYCSRVISFQRILNPAILSCCFGNRTKTIAIIWENVTR